MPYDRAFITSFAINLATPCMVFSSLSRLHLSGDDLLTMAASSFLCILIGGLLALPLLLLFRLPLRVYLPALSFPNGGNMGLPVCLFAFGETGLGLGVLFFATLAVLQFTVGPALAAGRMDPRQLLRTPVIYAVLSAVLVLTTGLQPPQWLLNTTSLLGSCAVPLMLFSLGVALAGLKVQGLARALGLSTLRLVLGFGAGVLVTHLLGLTGAMRGVVILQSAMPVAVFNYLWAVRFQTAPEEVAGMVLGSTALAFVALPLILLFVL